jgi:uncharacterized protein (UPF0332 family)
LNGNEFIALASHLVVNSAFGNAEARYRSAISRAYYGAFHLVIEFLEYVAAKRIPENHTGHEQAYRMLFSSGVPAAMEAARALNDLRGERNRADYKLHAKGMDNRANAQEKVELAVYVRNSLEQCRLEPAKSEILAALTLPPGS